MDLAYEIARYLANAGYGTLGTNIFVSQIPANQNGIYVVRTGGQLNDYIPIQETALDIYCKDTSASDCITTLESIKKYIHRMHTTLTTNAYIYSIRVIGDVETVERDLEYAKLFKLTISVINRDIALIS